MDIMDQEIIDEFVVESTEHLADIENQLLLIESAGADIDLELVNTVFRGVHSIKGAAGFLGLSSIQQLAHSLENVLNQIREQNLVPTSGIVDVMLQSADSLKRLLADVPGSNDVNVSEHAGLLDLISEGAIDGAADTTAVVNEEAPCNTPTQGNSDLPTQMEHAKPAPMPPDVAQVDSPIAKIKSDTSIRVSVDVLDQLMNLAGELVLSRNQLLQTVNPGENVALDSVSSRINQVTCEVQAAIMQTRMQPIGNVFGRYTRVVRDLSTKLGKQCRLELEGEDVEVDKTIIEAITDPLTHLVRNAVDHGLELPQQRQAKGKEPYGTVTLRAKHMSGKVCIEIIDDGAGMDAAKIRAKAVESNLLTAEQAERLSDQDTYRLIFAAGFSTAEQLSDVSGRGVGMDVVRNNIEKLGGTVEVSSRRDRGSTVRVMLPLTLAIIPSLIVRAGSQRFAIPQVSITELVRVRKEDREARITQVKGAQVLRLRGNLVPLVGLRDAVFNEAVSQSDDNSQALNIIIVETGQFQYALSVDALFDSEEIVVKPLGPQFKECVCLSGATILGDGQIALILDVAGIAAHMQLASSSDVSSQSIEESEDQPESVDSQSLLLFTNHPDEQFALSMCVIDRIERVSHEQIDSVGGQLVLQYRGRSLPLLRLEEQISATPAPHCESVYVVVFEVHGIEVGLIIPGLHDIRRVSQPIDESTLRQNGVVGSFVIDEVATRMLDIHELVANSHLNLKSGSMYEQCQDEYRVLLAEDSAFFRNQIKKYFEDAGHDITVVNDGAAAWDLIDADPEKFDLIVSDIQMPRMDGFQLCSEIRSHSATRGLPVIAVTSLAGQQDVHRGRECGFDDYQVKLDREKLMNSVIQLMNRRKGNSSRSSLVV